MCGNFEEFSLTHMCMKFGLVSYNVLKSLLCHHKKVGVFYGVYQYYGISVRYHGSDYVEFPRKLGSVG